MALETFDYPDGTSGADITGATVYEGSFVVQDKKLTSTSSVNNRLVWGSQYDGFQVIQMRATSSVGFNCGTLFRATDTNNYLSAFYRSQDGLIRVTSRVGGVNTELGTNTYTLDAPTDPVTMIVQHIGTGIKVWFNGSLRMTATDSSGLTGTDAGVRMDAGDYEVMSYQYWDSPNYAAITNQPNDLKVIPRTSSDGGLFGKGEATSSFTVTLSGSLEYRLVSEDLATEIHTWQTFTSGVETTFTVPADKQWYRLQFRIDGTNTFYSNRFGCGGITRAEGQSLAVRLYRAHADDTTLEDLGITVSPYHSVCATYEDRYTYNLPIWTQYADDTIFNSAFYEFLNKKIEEEDVVWAMGGLAHGGEQIQNFLPSGDDGAKMKAMTDELEGWHEWYWFHGHNDALANTTRTAYAAALTNLFNSHETYNTISGVEVYCTSIPNIDTDAFGTDAVIAGIRSAHKDFCDSVGGTVIAPNDIMLNADGVHQNQQGSLDVARHLYRAQYGEPIGVTITGFTRTGATLELELNIPNNSGDLVSGGALSKIISVSLKSDPWVFLPIDSIVVGVDSITVTLSSDPATDDLYVFYGSEQLAANGDWIRDSYSLDSFSVGRDFNSTLITGNDALIYEGDIVPPSNPPTANAGPDQSVAAGENFILDGSASTDSDGTIAEYRWTQTAGDTVTLDLTDPVRPVGVAPSKSTAQTLTFSLITVDNDGLESVADTVNIDVAAEVIMPPDTDPELLEAVAKQKFTIQPTTVMPAFTGRSNIEELKFKLVSTNSEINLDNQGFYDFDENETDRVIVITEDGEVSSENGDIEWEGSSLYVRLGAFSTRQSQLSARVVVFLAGDERGVVFAGPGLPANLIIKFH